MFLLQNFSIQTKILSVLVPLCIIGIGAAGALSIRYKAADTAHTELIAVDNNTAIQLARASRNLTATSYGAYQIIANDPSAPQFKQAVDFYQDSKTQLTDRLQNVRQNTRNDAAVIDAYISKAREVIALTDQAVSFAQKNDGDQAKAQLLKADAIIMPMTRDMAAFNDGQIAKVLKKSDDLTALANSTILTLLGVTGTAFLFGIFLAIFVIRQGINRPIARLCAGMASLAAGNTAAQIDGSGRKDEIGQMAKALLVFRDNAIECLRLEQETAANRTLSDAERLERETQKAKEASDTRFAVDHLAAGLAKLSDGDVSYRIQQPFTAPLDPLRSDFNASAEKLQAALVRVAHNAGGIDAGANEIRTAADDLAKRTEQQAAAVEETAAALEQITITVKDATKRAQEAGQLVIHTKAGAEQSGAVVRKAVVAMERIEKSSSEISNIISVIDEIAFQTNLLALNAGVEAARAGEAGKGFAVVAQEVRELAQRSAHAAKEIKALILTSNEQVEEGVKLVGETGRALEAIVSEVQEINRHVSAIVESAQEQSSGLQQINTAVNQMDQDTQKNAAMVEETTAASHSLATEVVSLNRLLGQFKLADRGHLGTGAPIHVARGRDKPSASPARALGRKLASAFAGNAALDASKSEWEDF